jgi:S-adenosyl-L-methionine hydrolase (adenosine-forming)
MPLITFLSDFGYTEHYVAGVKAKILSLAPQATIVDISHAIEPFNIAHGLYVLNSVFAQFPEGTVHIVAIDTHGSREGRFHAIKYKGHFFLAADNGILSLLTESQPDQMVQLANTDYTISPARDIFAPAAVHLAKGGDLTDLGEETTHMRQLINRQLRLNDHSITGHVIHVDHFGNLITNITRESVETIAHGRNFTIHFAREVVHKISPTFNIPIEGETVCVFNSEGLLTIGINKGHASELLGLHFDSQVDVRFYPEE